MTDREFDLLDELYFVESIDNLVFKLGWTHQELYSELKNLFEKNWIKIMSKTTKLEIKLPDFPSDFQDYEYLASKKGLMAHNTRM